MNERAMNERTMIVPPASQVNIDHVAAVVAKYWNLTLDDLRGTSRRWHISHPRFIAMAIAYRYCGMSLEAIGEKFGGRDHTTVLHGVRRISELRQADQHFHAQVCEIERELGLIADAGRPMPKAVPA